MLQQKSKLKELLIGNPKRRSFSALLVGNRVNKDSDSDGVPNIFDCQPFNPKKDSNIVVNLLKRGGTQITPPNKVKEEVNKILNRGGTQITPVNNNTTNTSNNSTSNKSHKKGSSNSNINKPVQNNVSLPEPQTTVPVKSTDIIKPKVPEMPPVQLSPYLKRDFTGNIQDPETRQQVPTYSEVKYVDPTVMGEQFERPAFNEEKWEEGEFIDNRTGQGFSGRVKTQENEVKYYENLEKEAREKDTTRISSTPYTKVDEAKSEVKKFFNSAVDRAKEMKDYGDNTVSSIIKSAGANDDTLKESSEIISKSIVRGSYYNNLLPEQLRDKSIQLLKGAIYSNAKNVRDKPTENIATYGIGKVVGATATGIKKGYTTLTNLIPNKTTRKLIQVGGKTLAVGSEIGIGGYITYETTTNIVKAPTTEEKGEFIGSTALELSLFGAGAESGSNFVDKITKYKRVRKLRPPQAPTSKGIDIKVAEDKIFFKEKIKVPRRFQYINSPIREFFNRPAKKVTYTKPQEYTQSGIIEYDNDGNIKPSFVELRSKSRPDDFYLIEVEGKAEIIPAETLKDANPQQKEMVDKLLEEQSVKRRKGQISVTKDTQEFFYSNLETNKVIKTTQSEKGNTVNENVNLLTGKNRKNRAEVIGFQEDVGQTDIASIKRYKFVTADRTKPLSRPRKLSVTKGFSVIPNELPTETQSNDIGDLFIKKTSPRVKPQIVQKQISSIVTKNIPKQKPSITKQTKETSLLNKSLENKTKVGSGLSIIQTPVLESANRQETSFKITQMFSQEQNNSLLFDNAQRSNLDTAQTPTNDEALREGLGNISVLSLNIDEAQRNPTNQTTSIRNTIAPTQYPKPKVPITPQPEKIFGDIWLPGEKQTKDDGKGYNAYVYIDATKKEKAHYEKLNNKPLNRISALSVMAREVDNTISARGKIERTKGNGVNTGDQYYDTVAYKFRNFMQRMGNRVKGNGVYIEKQKYRLDRGSETKEIQSVRGLFGI